MIRWLVAWTSVAGLLSAADLTVANSAAIVRRMPVDDRLDLVWRWLRSSRRTRGWPLACRTGPGAVDGPIVLRGSRTASYLVDRTASGRYLMAERSGAAEFTQ
jgi:hypothetical protein